MNVHAIEPTLVKLTPSPKKVLFLGNSFTYYNGNLSHHLERLVHASTATEAFKHYGFRSITISGGRLAEHRKILPPLMTMQPWDAVILQGHSLATIKSERWPAFIRSTQQIGDIVQQEGATPTNQKCYQPSVQPTQL